jgi:nicotinate-nucleotide adenylyltransferase
VPEVKIGFFGGSFDPVHFGHLCAAQDAYEQCGLDRLFLVPTAQAPLKPQGAQTPAQDRLAMLRAAVEPDPRFEISDHELRTGGMSYTIDSVRHFRGQFPNDQLFWIVGEDQLSQLHLWKNAQELATMIEFIVLGRPGHPDESRPKIPGLRFRRCGGHLLEISSTELRERVRRGLPLDYFIPHKTIVYINDKGLYR